MKSEKLRRNCEKQRLNSNFSRRFSNAPCMNSVTVHVVGDAGFLTDNPNITACLLFILNLCLYYCQ